MTRKKKSKEPKGTPAERVEGSDESASQAVAKLDELSSRIDDASTLIAELREKNHLLKAEAAELRREVEAGSEAASPDGDASSGESAPALLAEVEQLRREREAIRGKVESLLVRIEKLEPYADGD